MLALDTACFRDRVTLFQTAVWNRNTGLVFSDSQFAMATNGLGPAVSQKRARFRRLKHLTFLQFSPMSSFQRVELLKVDIERGEFVLFDESAENWIKLVDTIAIGLHGSDCENAFHTIVGREDFLVSHCEELTVCSRNMPSGS
jgi:hypothetical protein